MSVIKATLCSFYKDETLALSWEAVLQDMNKAVLEAYILANVHVVRLCEAQIALEPVDQNLYYRSLSAATAGSTEVYNKPNGSAAFVESVQLYRPWRSTAVPPVRNDDIARGWQHSAARQMNTNASNPVKLSFYRRLHKYLWWLYGLKGKDTTTMIKNILSPEYDVVDAEIWMWCERIPRKENGKLNSQPHLLLPLMNTFLK